MRFYRHLRRGSFYQYYATVHYLTCERCLRRHGEIFDSGSLDSAPPIHEGCRCQILEFPANELEEYRLKAKRMKAKAEEEIMRRRLFAQAENILTEDPQKAFTLFQNAVAIDIYVEELEGIYQRNSQFFSCQPEFTKRLSELFLKYYKLKWSLDKYRMMPEGMRAASERAGVERIKELFHEATLKKL